MLVAIPQPLPLSVSASPSLCAVDMRSNLAVRTPVPSINHPTVDPSQCLLLFLSPFLSLSLPLLLSVLWIWGLTLLSEHLSHQSIVPLWTHLNACCYSSALPPLCLCLSLCAVDMRFDLAVRTLLSEHPSQESIVPLWTHLNACCCNPQPLPLSVSASLPLSLCCGYEVWPCCQNTCLTNQSSHCGPTSMLVAIPQPLPLSVSASPSLCAVDMRSNLAVRTPVPSIKWEV